MKRCRDWRDCAPAEIAPLLTAETRAWLEDLGWDVRTAWRVVEPARRSGHLPGFVMYDRNGRPEAWTAFLPYRGCLQVLAFVAPTAETAEVLLDEMLSSREARTAEATIFCVRSSSPSLAAALAARGFGTEHYRYLSKALTTDDARRAAGRVEGVQHWAGHAEAMTRLCARAYAASEGIRAFAPNGTLVEWQEYVNSLIDGVGCGRFAPDLSFIVPGERPGTLAAAVLVSDLGPSTIHVSQLVVDPAVHGLGLGTRLMRAVEGAAIARDARDITLLVAASNVRALSIYERQGFEDRARFVVALRRRGQPILSTSLALDTGGDSTRL